MRGGLPSRAKLLVVALLLGAAILASSRSARPALALTAAAPTPGPGAMTVYSITNPNSATLNVQQVISDSNGFSYTLWSDIPAGSTITYHLRDIPQIPSPFQGTLTLYASQPFTAQIVGYDYPIPLTPRVWLPVVVDNH